MKYTLLIHSSPMQATGAPAAFKFAQALLSQGHSIYRVFLYGDAAHLSNSTAVYPQEDVQLNLEWAKLIQDNKIDAVVCIAAALKRGILNEQECTRHSKSAAVLESSYELSGLGQLIDAAAHSEKVITFS